MFLNFFVNYITIRNFPEEHSDTWSNCGRIRHVCQIRHVVESDMCVNQTHGRIRHVVKSDTWSNQTYVSKQTHGRIRHVCQIRHVVESDMCVISDMCVNQTRRRIRHVVKSDTWSNQTHG